MTGRGRTSRTPILPVTSSHSRDVRVPYSVIYDLRGDQISALRIYFPMNLLIEQLTR